MKKGNKISPPAWGIALFKSYCRNELADSILGDMQERFHKEAIKRGATRAKFNFILSIFSFINRHTLRGRSGRKTKSNSTAMFRNYLLITFRNLKKRPVFSFINIFGLALGLASCMIIYFYVQHELGTDQFHSKADRVYKVSGIFESGNSRRTTMRTPPALAPHIKGRISGIERVTRMRYADEHIFGVGDHVFSMDQGFYADSVFLDVFDFELQMGNPQTALRDPNSIVINEATAIMLFGNENPMGKFIRFNNEKDLEVTGVFKEFPGNTHFKFDYLMSFNTFVVPEGYLADLTSWGWTGFHTYILLSPNVNTAEIEADINDIFKANYARSSVKVTNPLINLRDLYLGSGDYGNLGHNILIGDWKTLYVLCVIAALVLLIAGFNFMNLSTAISIKRAKEIGMRKVMGAVKGKIRQQFLTESIILALTSFLCAMAIFALLSGFISNQLQVPLPDQATDLLPHLPLFIAITILIGFLAGIYPSVFLSSFKPIAALKMKVQGSNSRFSLKQILTATQFIISVSLISASFIVVDQIDHMVNHPLGFERNNVLKMNISQNDMSEHYRVLKDRFLAHTEITHVTRASHTFEGGAGGGPAWLQGASQDDSHQLSYYQTGYDFAELTGLQMQEGRYFSKDFSNDWEEGMILNESAVAYMGLEQPIGQRIRFNDRDRVVIGVVNDFNYRSLHTPIAPMAIVMPFGTPERLLIKVQSGSAISEVIAKLEQDWNTIVQDAPFDLAFMEDDIQRMYEKETQLSGLVSVFASLAVILAILGLYGLVSFSVQARLKEVGIRKVHGASTSFLLVLLSKRFLILVLVANLIAWPLVFLSTSQWLEGFHYRIGLNLNHFLLPFLILTGLTIITLSHQVLKTALANPVDVLRNE